jgi:hypothetical protein
MRNDSRLFGEHSPASPIGGTQGPSEDDRPIPSERPDSRDTIAHGRESHVVHPSSEENGRTDANAPAAPQDGRTRKTQI